MSASEPGFGPDYDYEEEGKADWKLLVCLPFILLGAIFEGIFNRRRR